ncbi:MAG: B12-binding domain-containing radical SAM protein [Planctomycetes bacterium]|nr:B12-binding domain-containing radical SAM protein [Planctomycetota bacterium]
MKILLIWTDCTTNECPRPHLGFTYLVAAIRRQGRHEAAVQIFWKKPTRQEVWEVMEREKPALVGATSMTSQWPVVYPILTAVRQKYRVPVVVGGIHAAFATEGVLSCPAVDMVCRGDGEETICSLADALEEGRPLDQVPNLVSKRGDGSLYTRPGGAGLTRLPWADRPGYATLGPLERDLDADHYVVGPVHQPAQNLDDLPWADYSLLPMDHILLRNGGDFYHASARGCPFTCTYCCSPMYAHEFKGDNGKVVRRLSPDRITAELKAAAERYPDMRRVTLLDDVFAPPLPWLERFAEVYPREVGLPINAMLRPESARPDLLRLLRKAGVEDVMLGLEAGNEQIRRDVLRRNLSNERMIKAFQLCREHGMRTLAYVMVGVPGETEATMNDTYEMVKLIEPDYVTASIFFPFPGTPLYTECEKNGWIELDAADEDIPGDYYERSWVNHPNLTRDQVRRAFQRVLALGASITPRRLPRGAYDFLAHLGDAKVTVPDGARVYISSVAASYPEGCWLFAPAGSRLVYENVRLPERAGAEIVPGLQAALDEFAPSGVRYQMKVDGDVAWEKTLDFRAEARPDGRCWEEHAVDLSRHGGRTVTVELAIDVPADAPNHLGLGWGRSQIVDTALDPVRREFSSKGGRRARRHPVFRSRPLADPTQTAKAVFA